MLTAVAKWDGTAWSPLGSGMDLQVHALALDDGGILYAGGYFTTAGGVSANHIATWDGVAWSSLGGGMGGEYPCYDRSVNALVLDDVGTLYAGGCFTTSGSASANNIAKWNGTTWSRLGKGMDYQVYALALDAAGILYAGGDFTLAGSKPSRYIARWARQEFWLPLVISD